MNEITFNSLEELYNRLKPALKTKVDEFKLNNYECKEIDIWSFFKDKWSKQQGLSLSEMVMDIINLDLIDLDNYLKNVKNI